MIFQLLFISIVGFTLIIYNAYIILWGVHKNIPDFDKKRKQWSRIWHKTGWFLRFEIGIALLYIMIFGISACYSINNLLFSGGWFLLWMLLLYDIGINIIRKTESPTTAPNIFYVDNKGFNKYLLKYLKTNKSVWIFKFSIVFILLFTALINKFNFII